MIKAVDRIGVEHKISFCFSLSQCSVPIPTNKNIVSPPFTPLGEIALRKKNGAHVRIPLVEGIIYMERVRKNKKSEVKK